MAQDKFAPFESGQAPTLLNADRANAVQDSCAAFESLTVLPTGSGKLTVNGRKAILDLSGFASTASGEGTPCYFLRNGVLVSANIVTVGEITSV